MKLRCGECKRYLHESNFNVCENENCYGLSEHPRNKGYYCKECDINNKISRYRKGHIFCSLECYKEWREKDKKEKEEKKRIKLERLENNKFEVINTGSKFKVLDNML